jgi:hypothetical protein
MYGQIELLMTKSTIQDEILPDLKTVSLNMFLVLMLNEISMRGP